MEQEFTKPVLISWYDKNRWKLFAVNLTLSVIACILFALSNKLKLEQGFMVCEPEFIDYYNNYQTERIASANTMGSVTMVISLGMFLTSLKSFKQRCKAGAIIYNLALVIQAYSLGRYMYIMLDVYERIPYIGILYVIIGVGMVITLIMNLQHYKKYIDIFAENNNSRFLIFVPMLLILSIVAISMFGIDIQKNRIREEKNKYESKEFIKMYEVLWVEPDESIHNNPVAFVGLQYVNLFNDRGRTYTVEEMEQAIYNSYYNAGSWYAMKEFNDDLKAIEDKYDFRKYSLDEDPDNQEGHEIFYQLVKRRLLCTGKDILDREYITNDEIKEACIYVYNLLTTGKTMDKIGNAGDVINITYDGKLEAGEMAVLTCSSETDNIHTVIRKWNGVVKVGIDDDIDECFVYADDELIFEEECIYRAEITIYPEITYYFDENI